MVSKDMTFLLALAVSALCATMVSSSSEMETENNLFRSEMEPENNLQSLVSEDEGLDDDARLFGTALLSSDSGDTQIAFTGWEWALLFGSIVALTALFSVLLAGDLGKEGGGGGGGGFADSFGPAPTGFSQATGFAQPAPAHQSGGFDSSYAVNRQLDEAVSKYQ